MSDPASTTAAAVPTWSPTARRIASVLITLHVAAVFVAPFAFACTTPSGSSPFADGLMRLFRPYIDALYLNHGYAFFAPNPGPSHLVRYRVEFDDGRESVEGMFPDLKTQRPRLLYHRHFMLAEQLHNLYTPAEPPPEIPLDDDLARALTDPQRRELAENIRRRHREILQGWKHSRDVYQSFRHSLEEHLKSRHRGDSVTLTRVEHGLLVPEVFRVLRRLDAPHTYRNLPDGAPAPEVLRPEGPAQP
ncbi:MAG TPA: hypothetical protein VMP01_23415 [Pirellulaceae bacterium]|nr:hypothetical protein [Pirellulaceae bacterium]